MKTTISLLFGLLLVATGAASGCAYNKPLLTETTKAPDGTVTERRLSLPTVAIWPATTQLEKQRATLGKTLSVGTAGLQEETGSTNVVQALMVINSILGKLHP